MVNEMIDYQKEEDQVNVDESPSNFKLHNQPTQSNNKNEKSRDGFRIDWKLRLWSDFTF